MTVHGGPSFGEWQLDRLAGHQRFKVLMRWWILDHPGPLIIRMGARSREAQEGLLRRRMQHELLVNQRKVMVLGPPARIQLYGF